MNLKRYVVREVEAVLRGLIEGDVLTAELSADADVVVLQALGDALRLELEIPPELRRWYRGASLERLDAAAFEAVRTTRNLTLPVEPGELLKDGNSFDVVLRDGLESVRIGLFRALIERNRELDATLGAVPNGALLYEELRRFDVELSKVASRAEVARALGARAGMISGSWWGLRFPR